MAFVPYDSGVVYMSNRIYPSAKQYQGPDGKPLYNLYYVPVKEGKPGTRAESKKFLSWLPHDVNYGPVTFAQNDQMMCMVIENGSQLLNLPDNGNAGLYFAYKSNDQWSEFIPFPHNDPELNFNTPHLTEDGYTLYFAADSMEGSVGSWDLFYSEFINNEWTKPRNLGPVINTPSWEFFPFYHKKTRRLYFSSNGHNARNETFDIFSSTKRNGQWLKPAPIPLVNNYTDEFAVYLSEDLKGGYFTRKTNTNDFSPQVIQIQDYKSFENIKEIIKTYLCYRIYDRKLDTIDTDVYDYEWIIHYKDSVPEYTESVPGHEIIYCFPGPGNYYCQLNITNKETREVNFDVARTTVEVPLHEQPYITMEADTAYVGLPVRFNAEKTVWTKWPISEYIWDFGEDLTQSTGTNVEYTYNQPGEFDVVLGIVESVARRRDTPREYAVSKRILVLPSPQ